MWLYAIINVKFAQWETVFVLIYMLNLNKLYILSLLKIKFCFLADFFWKERIFMKMKIRTVFLALGVTTALSAATPCYALETKFSPYDRSLNVNGECTASDLSLAVMPYGYTVDGLNVSAINGENGVIFQHIKAGSTYSEKLLLPTGFSNGKYRACEIAGGRVLNSVFFGVSNDTLSAAVSAVNGAKSTQEAKEAVFDLAGETKSDVLSANMQRLGAFLYNERPEAGYDAEGLFEKFTLCEGILNYEAGNIGFSTLMEEYSSAMSEDLKKSYTALSDEQKAQTDKLLIKDGEKTEGILNEAIFVGCAKAANNFSDLKDLFEEYIKTEGIIVEEYDGLSTDYAKQEVFIELFKERNGFTDADYIINRVKALSPTEEGSNNGTNNGNSGGFGGGGGSSSGGTAGSVGSGIFGGTFNDETQASKTAFSDITLHWAKNEIEKMHSLGIVNGTGKDTFEPERAVTRAEFVKMLSGTLKLTLSGTECGFADVEKNSWYYPYIAEVVKRGIVSGISETEFAPEMPIKREEAATMVYRAASEKLFKKTECDFADERTISGYAKEAVKALSCAEIIKGSDGSFNPKSNITRAEAAVLLLRIYNLG